MLDLAVDEGTVTLAVDPATMLPRSVSWSAPHQNLGEVVLTTSFVGYQNWDGVMLPLTWSTRIDWRNTLVQTRMLDGYYLNSTHTADIAAPGSVREQPVPQPATPTQPISATRVADGIWHLNPGGHTIVEFADHLVIFEMGGSSNQTRAVVDFANTLVAGKPLTHLIVSHHHFDHTSGFRAAIEAGLTVISHRGNEPILREMAMRPAPDFADLVALPDGGTFDFVPVDGHLRLEDERMTLDWIRQGVPAALARCDEYAELGRNLPGCPAYLYRDWSAP